MWTLTVSTWLPSKSIRVRKFHEPSQIEHVWEVLSRIPRRTNTAIGLTAVCANLDFAPKSPDEQVALMTRYALLDALLERGILKD